MASAPRWLIYALGGGVGHLTRAIALARQAVKCHSEVTVVLNSPWASSLPLENELSGRGRVIRVAPDMPKDAVAKVTRAMIAYERYHVLVVDTFPRGLAGELVDLLPQVRCLKVLVQRDLNPVYVAQYHLAKAAMAFDLTLIPADEPQWANHPQSIRTHPWLIRDASEIQDREAARDRLHVSDASPVVGVIAAGRPEEQAHFLRLSRSIDMELSTVMVRAFSPDPSVGSEPQVLSHWPAVEMFAGLDALVGAGGYNTVAEARATHTPLIATTMPRLYDRQELRLHSWERFDDISGMIRQVQQQCQTERAAVPDYINGAAEAVSVIHSQLSIEGQRLNW